LCKLLPPLVPVGQDVPRWDNLSNCRGGVARGSAMVGRPPRVTRLLWPTYCPRAHPIERALGNVPDGCTRKHRRTRVSALVAEVKAHLHGNSPWPYKRSQRYSEPAITAAVAKIAAEEQAKVAA
jgi:hypothetical protein